MRNSIFRPHFPLFSHRNLRVRSARERKSTVFTAFVLVRSPYLFIRLRSAIHRWKALIAKEKKKEREGGGREGEQVVFGLNFAARVDVCAMSFNSIRHKEPVPLEHRNAHAKARLQKSPAGWGTGRGQNGQNRLQSAPKQAGGPVYRPIGYFCFRRFAFIWSRAM